MSTHDDPTNGDSSLQKVIFRLERDEDGFPPVEMETLWVRACAEKSQGILDSIPFFADDVALNDVVELDRHGDEIWYRNVVTEGGHTTTRVYSSDPDVLARLREDLLQLGCRSERSQKFGLLAVDVPPSVDYREVVSFLKGGEDRGQWEYFEGVVRHDTG